MLRVTFLLCLTITLISCSSTRESAIQSFSPIAIDLSRIDQKDYSELIQIVNSSYEGKDEFKTATLLSESANYLYVQVGGAVSGACYKVTVDRHRAKIVSMQPDCPIEEE